jgi:DNA repair and recombination protein RAD52
MTFSPEQIKLLQAKLDPANIAKRTQSGQQLTYIEGWHAIAEANRIFGFDAWDRETVDLRCVSERPRKIGREPNQRDGWGVSYVAKVRITVDNGIIREGVGAGHGIDVDCGLAHESAIKEAETDAMKRALSTFGNPFGLALYDKSHANVGVDEPDYVAESREIARLIGATASLPDLVDLWKTARVQDFLKAAPRDLANSVTSLKEERKHTLTPKKEAA